MNRVSVIGEIVYQNGSFEGDPCIAISPDRYHEDFPDVLRTSKKYTKRAVIKIENQTTCSVLKFNLDRTNRKFFKKNPSSFEVDQGIPTYLELKQNIHATPQGVRIEWDLDGNPCGLEMCPPPVQPHEHSEVVVEC